MVMALRISLLLDGQLPPDEVPAALSAISADAAARDRYTVYGLVGDTLRALSVPDDGFSVRILERMHREGVRMEQGYDPLVGDR
jgi:negative regulator of sigma E activity